MKHISDEHQDNDENKVDVDPRIQAKETLFKQLHLATFDTMSYLQTVLSEVQNTQQDIREDNEDYQQLLRDYAVTKRLTAMTNTQCMALCERTDRCLAMQNQAFATYAQLCAAASNALNYLRILNEIPADLVDSEQVTRGLKQNMQLHVEAWEKILGEEEC